MITTPICLGEGLPWCFVGNIRGARWLAGLGVWDGLFATKLLMVQGDIRNCP